MDDRDDLRHDVQRPPASGELLDDLNGMDGDGGFDGLRDNGPVSEVEPGLEELDGIGDVDDDDDFQTRVARRQPHAHVEALLHEVYDVIDQARPAPLSAAVKVDRDELLDLLDQAIERLPEEVRSARWLVKERDEFLARTRREADEILEAARAQSERMVQRSEVLRSAEAEARRVVDDARSTAARIRNQCDDYCDQRLAQLEAVLERSMAVIGAGRAKLRPLAANGAAGDHADGAGNGTGDDGAQSEDVAVHDGDQRAARVELEIFDQDSVQ